MANLAVFILRILLFGVLYLGPLFSETPICRDLGFRVERVLLPKLFLGVPYYYMIKALRTAGGGRVQGLGVFIGI